MLCETSFLFGIKGKIFLIGGKIDAIALTGLRLPLIAVFVFFGKQMLHDGGYNAPVADYAATLCQ